MKLKKLTGTAGVIDFTGKIGTDAAGNLDEVKSELSGGKYSAVILDFSGMKHMDSAGAALLIKFTAACAGSKISLFAVGLNERYREIFSLTGLEHGISVIKSSASDIPGLDSAVLEEVKKIPAAGDEQSDRGWSPYKKALDSSRMPKQALNRNVHGRKVTGPLQGFGPMWEKTYTLKMEKTGLKPEGLIDIMKTRLPSFQPPQNRFYASPGGIKAGEVVLIDSITPGGVVSTGVLVLYSDETSFSLITPQGHPEAGWVTFSASKKDDTAFFQIRGLASAGDPFYELAFRIAGSKFQETIWKHVLASLADYVEKPRDITVEKKMITSALKWNNTSGFRYNAQLRSLPLNLIPRAWRQADKK